MANRKDRESETRTNSIRYKPKSVLPDPKEDPYNDYKYVRTSIMGQDDARNVIARRQEGWEPCRMEDHPEIPIHGKTSGEVEIGGLMLHKVPKGFKESREDHFRQATKAQAQSVDVNMKREQDPRMPMFSERKSTTSNRG